MSREHDAEKGKREIPVEEISKLLGVVSDKVPHLIKSIKEVVYSPEAGKGMGQAVGNFYKELITSGIDTELASSLTRDYLSTMKSFSDKLDQRGSLSFSPHVLAHKIHKHHKHGETSGHDHEDEE
ncbi:MAG: hypothetical protein DDT20_01587 [Firmicutes bacterium]|nr:hypothetical protein [Bacillota bacterium]